MRKSAFSKWWLVGAYWLFQAMVIYAVTPLWLASAANVDPANGNMGAIEWGRYRMILMEHDWIAMSASLALGFMVGQVAFVWPVRKPTAKNQRGWPLWVSLVIAGLTLAALSTALMISISQVIFTYTQLDLLAGSGVSFEVAALAYAVLNWVIATPLLIRFCRRGPRESLLARVSSRLFVGTVIEVVAIIPMDVMVRRKESCYCLAGTYFGMIICGGAGLLMFGPAIFLPLIVKRRRRWYDGKCDGCGYDLSATPKADRCPECGLGWRPGGKNAAAPA